MSAFIACYGTEAQYEQALEQARGPDAFVWPACGEGDHSRFLADGRRCGQCARCRTQTTVRSGILFNASKLPLTKWFQAIYLVTDGCASFDASGAKVAAHVAIIVGKRKSRALAPFRWVNTFISNAKNAITGTYHHVDFDNYRHRYLAESQYRVHRRFDRPR